jgi:DNA-binding NarL/FixJ family response regulator
LLLVDDHPLMLAGLAGVLDAAEDLCVVGTAANGDDALVAVANCTPEVVLMDLSMPGTDGIVATRRILGEHPNVKVLVLTSFSNRELILDAVQAGAVGYLLKDSDVSVLLRGIRAAARGEAPLDPRAAREVLRAQAFGAPPPTPVAALLTQREREVLLLLCEGMSNREIGVRLDIVESTVKSHLSLAFQRIGVSDRTAAAVWVHENLHVPADPQSSFRGLR